MHLVSKNRVMLVFLCSDMKEWVHSDTQRTGNNADYHSALAPMKNSPFVP